MASGPKLTLHSALVMSMLVAFCLSTKAADGTEDSTLRLNDPAQPVSGSQTHGDLKFEYTHYNVPLAGQPKLNQSSMIEADLKTEYKTELTRSRLDFTAGKFVDLNNSFFGIQELYTSVQFLGDHVTAALGRKIEFWSEVDQDWQLGLWEPKSNLIDSLRPVNQGLTGVFARAESGNFQLLAYGSTLFIPTIGPNVSEKDGALVSDSRWYTTPTGSGDVLNKNTRFVYSLNVPELRKLVSKPGAGVRLRYGGTQPGFWASANYARKPVNSLLIKYDYNLYLRATGAQAEIDVAPVVAYHQLYGADVGWLFEKGMLSASYLRDDPQTDDPINELNSDGQPKTDWIQQRPGHLKIAAAHAESSVRLPWILDPVGLNLDYIRATEESTRDYDSAGSARGSLIPYRMNFTNAASLRTNVSTVLFSHPLMTSFRYLREFDQKGSLWTLIAQYAPQKDWLLHMGVDILGVDDSSAENADPHFLNQFRANDRAFGGLSYVF